MKILTALTITAIALAFNLNTARAETCEGGTTVDKFCISNNKMNWWSAYTWCEAQGMKLASAYDLCPTWDGAFEDYRCGTTNGITPTVWTSTPHANNAAMNFSDNKGRMNYNYRTDEYSAACIAK